MGIRETHRRYQRGRTVYLFRDEVSVFKPSLFIVKTISPTALGTMAALTTKMMMKRTTMPRKSASVARRRSDAAEAEMMTTMKTSQSGSPVDGTDRNKRLQVMAARSSLAMIVKSSLATAAKSSLAMVVKSSLAMAAKNSQVMVKRAAVATTVVEKAAAVRMMMRRKKAMSTVNAVVVVDTRRLGRTEGMDSWVARSDRLLRMILPIR